MWELNTRKRNPMSYGEIGTLMGFKRSTVQHIIKKIKQTGEFEAASPPGRPPTLSKQCVIAVFGPKNGTFCMFTDGYTG